MSEARVLSLVAAHPHPRALARHLDSRSHFAALRRLEACGLVRRVRGEYHVTRRGRGELETARAVGCLIARSLPMR